MKKMTIAILIALFCSTAVFGEELKPVMLPPPQGEGGMPLMQALKERKSMRQFKRAELPLQTLSDLLWAAYGINRPDLGGRTAPSTKNIQAIDIYITKSDGLYLYDAKANVLRPVLKDDLRAMTGNQSFVKDAPVNLVFVADLSKLSGIRPDDIDFCIAGDTGFISENVYLYCASAGLATVVRGWLDRPRLAKAMKLRQDQRVVFAQTVGFPEGK